MMSLEMTLELMVEIVAERIRSEYQDRRRCLGKFYHLCLRSEVYH